MNEFIVQTKFIDFPEGIELDGGGCLAPVTVAYETYGKLNAAGDNALLILHALTGDAHAAGKHSPQEKTPGWWDDLIGPGLPFDTEKYFILCSNVLGGCKGTTGPASTNPKTGKPYGMDFPIITIRDMVRAQKKLADALGINSFAVVAGGSMGGMQALEWGVTYPEMVKTLIPIATSARLSPFAIAFNEVQRQAIYLDPNWNKGCYEADCPPANGLAIARMLGTITYKSDESFNNRFGRQVHDLKNGAFTFDGRFAVENYLHYQGNKLVDRFDTNTYLYLTKAMDLHDVGRGYPSYEQALSRITARTLLIGIDSDFLFPPYQQKEIYKILKAKGGQAEYNELRSPHGHDAFLIEFKKIEKLIGEFLR